MMEALTAIRRRRRHHRDLLRARGGADAAHVMKKPARSKQLFLQASRSPGGVNSPIRAFQAVGGAPLFIRRASVRSWRTSTAIASSTMSCRRAR